MSASLQPRASAAADSQRALERALAEAKSHWNDPTRRAFDQRHVEPVLVLGRRAATELADLARELDRALADLHQAECG